MHVFCNLYSKLDSEGLRLHLRHSVTSRMPVAKPTCLARSYAAWSALWADGLAASTEGHLPANRNGKKTKSKESPFDATAVAQQYLTLFPEDEQLNYPGFARGRFGQTLISRAQELQELSTTRLQEICGQVSVHAQCAKHGPTWHLRHSYTDCERAAVWIVQISPWVLLRKGVGDRQRKSATAHRRPTSSNLAKVHLILY